MPYRFIKRLIYAHCMHITYIIIPMRKLAYMTCKLHKGNDSRDDEEKVCYDGC